MSPLKLLRITALSFAMPFLAVAILFLFDGADRFVPRAIANALIGIGFVLVALTPEPAPLAKAAVSSPGAVVEDATRGR